MRSALKNEAELCAVLKQLEVCFDGVLQRTRASLEKSFQSSQRSLVTWRIQIPGKFVWKFYNAISPDSHHSYVASGNFLHNWITDFFSPRSCMRMQRSWCNVSFINILFEQTEKENFRRNRWNGLVWRLCLWGEGVDCWKGIFLSGNSEAEVFLMNMFCWHSDSYRRKAWPIDVTTQHHPWKENPLTLQNHFPADVGPNAMLFFLKKGKIFVFDNNGKFVQWDLWGFTLKNVFLCLEHNEYEGRPRSILSPLILEMISLKGSFGNYNNFFMCFQFHCANSLFD